MILRELPHLLLSVIDIVGCDNGAEAVRDDRDGSSGLERRQESAYLGLDVRVNLRIDALVFIGQYVGYELGGEIDPEIHQLAHHESLDGSEDSGDPSKGCVFKQDFQESALVLVDDRVPGYLLEADFGAAVLVVVETRLDDFVKFGSERLLEFCGIAGFCDSDTMYDYNRMLLSHKSNLGTTTLTQLRSLQTNRAEPHRA